MPPDLNHLDLHIESLIFASSQGISFDEIKEVLEAHFQTSVTDDALRQALDRIVNKYSHADFPFEVVEMNAGFRFLTKGSYHDTIGHYLKLNVNKKLSKSALETLSIIAYKQPVTKTDIESIRGVNCDYAVQKLMEKDLVEIVGRSDGPGRPLIYQTSHKFLDYFGLKSVEDLPKLKDVVPNLS